MTLKQIYNLMIIGIGTDLTRISRIAQSLNRFGQRFEQRIFSQSEQSEAKFRANKSAFYAKRWAAKEAFAKALGTGISGFYWTDIVVTNSNSGQPTIRLTGRAHSILKSKLPSHHQAHIHLSITDDPPWAQAFVVIEAQPLSE